MKLYTNKAPPPCGVNVLQYKQRKCGQQQLSSASAHFVFCIQSVTLSQSRPKNCPQPFLLKVSGPGSPLLSGQQVSLIHQQHVHLIG